MLLPLGRLFFCFCSNTKVKFVIPIPCFFMPSSVTLFLFLFLFFFCFVKISVFPVPGGAIIKCCLLERLIILICSSVKLNFFNTLKLSNIQKEEIISAISHEFKNPIAVINGYSETLLKNDVSPVIRKKFRKDKKKWG